MNRVPWCRWAQIWIILCGRLALVAADSANSTQADAEPFSSATPAPGGTEAAGTAGVTPPAAGLNSTTVNGTEPPPEATTADTEAPPATTVPPVEVSPACLCDLTPDFCDIGCCCDTTDCRVTNLTTVFTNCPQKPVSGVCLEKWLMFRANVNSSLITVTDSLFCVQPEDDAAQPPPAVPRYPAVGDSYHFSPPLTTSRSHGQDFYRVDDVIQTYFSNSSVRGLLRQPSSGTAASSSCVNRNPAKFLRSVSLSCTRMVTSQSCTTDPGLSARSYFSDLSLIKTPVTEEAPASDLLIPVTPLNDWPAPSLQNGVCVNAVRKVEFIVSYSGRGEVTSATVDLVLADVDLNQFLLQTHSVNFQLDTLSAPPEPIPAVGLRPGSPVIGRFDGEVKPLSSLGVSPGGVCSSDPSRRAAVLFTHNTVTGCMFSSSASDCSQLRSEIYGILQGLAAPEVLAMNSGSEPDWTRVITQDCPVSLQEEETCETGCMVPLALSIQVLWARQGLIELPQNHILGAKYLFQCQEVKCPTSSPLALTTRVAFADTTVYPEPPRGSPQPHWKFPFGFFTRGRAELDGPVLSGGATEVTWSLMLLTVMLITGLEFLSE